MPLEAVIRYLPIAAALLLLVGCGPTPDQARRLEQPTVSATPSSTTVVATEAKSWPVPDDTLTPGLVTPDCTYPRDDAERNVSASTKRAAAKRYSYTGPTGLEYVEYDHRIPFSLCGANTVANIWPQPVDGMKQTAFTANRKDQEEAFAARQVRYHRWTLKHAQDVFRGDWRAAWCKYRMNYSSAGVSCEGVTDGK
jgi:hypothetical protein